jgi:hypothetical protein
MEEPMNATIESMTLLKLLAGLITAVGAAYAVKLRRRNEMIKNAPEKEQPALIEKALAKGLLTIGKIELGPLTPKQKYDLVVKDLRSRLHYTILFSVVGLVAFVALLTWAYFNDRTAPIDVCDPGVRTALEERSQLVDLACTKARTLHFAIRRANSSVFSNGLINDQVEAAKNEYIETRNRIKNTEGALQATLIALHVPEPVVRSYNQLYESFSEDYHREMIFESRKGTYNDLVQRSVRLHAICDSIGPALCAERDAEIEEEFRAWADAADGRIAVVESTNRSLNVAIAKTCPK